MQLRTVENEVSGRAGRVKDSRFRRDIMYIKFIMYIMHIEYRYRNTDRGIPFQDSVFTHRETLARSLKGVI